MSNITTNLLKDNYFKLPKALELELAFANRQTKMLSAALSGGGMMQMQLLLQNNLYMDVQQEIARHTEKIDNLYNPWHDIQQLLKYNHFEDAISNINRIPNSCFVRVENPFADTISSQIELLKKSADTCRLPNINFDTVLSYIPDDYSITTIYKDDDGELDLFVSSRDNETEYRLSNLNGDKGFIDFLHDIPKKEVINFVTFLQDFPYLALENDVGKKIFQAAQEKIKKDIKVVDGEVFYRARAKKAGERDFTVNEMDEPQYGVPGMGRYNFVGKPYFYLATDAETVKNEVTSNTDNECTIAKYNQIKPMNVFDISSEDCPLVSYCNMEKKDGNNYTEYLVPNFLSVCCTYMNKKERHTVDAIKYKSTKNQSGFCYVILDKDYMGFIGDGEIVVQE